MGISPDLMFVNELRRISMNTMPLAPSSPACTRSAFSTPVTPAVMIAIASTIPEPNFSSSTGPIRRMKAKFDTRWAQLAWPMTWENRRSHEITDRVSRYAGAVNQAPIRVPPVSWSAPSTVAATIAKVRVTGALYRRRRRAMAGSIAPA